MNKFLMAALLAGGALLAGCTSSDDWSAGPEAEGAQVYFSSENATTYSIAVDDSSVEIELMRAETAGELDVPVTLTAGDEAYANLFTGASSVIFADGANKAVYTIAFDREALEDGTTYALKLEIDDPTLITAYGYSELALTLKVPEPFVLLGTGLFREDILAGIFNGLDFWEYECEIYENLKKPGLIYLKNVYTNLYYPYLDEDYDPETDADDYDTYFVIDISDPDNVVIPEQGLGLDLGYGEIWARSYDTGTLKDKIITFPEKGLDAMMTDYSNGQWVFYGNYSGMFRVALPGAVLTDYSVEIAYAGRFTDASDNNFAVAEVTGGEDVEYIEVALGAGSDPDAVRAALEAGEIESVRVEGNAGSARLPLSEDGTYTLIAISYGEGEAREMSYVTFKFYAGTAPELSPLEKEYTDVSAIDKEDLLQTWIMWGRDYYGDTDDRQPLNYVTFSQNAEDDDLIDVSGLTLGWSEDDDTTTWEYYYGYIYSLAPEGALGTVQGYTIGMSITDLTAGYIYTAQDYMLVGGVVDEGYLAMISGASNYDFDGICLRLYNDAEMTESAGNLEIYYDIMFEDPAVSSLSAKAASLKASKAKASYSKNELKSLAQSLSVRENYVETARGMVRRKIDEMRAAQASRRAAKGSFEILSSSKLHTADRGLRANKQVAAGAVVR